MPYELWRTEVSKGTPHIVQAFTFDGWSHEPLVIERPRDVLVVPKHDVLSTASDRTLAKATEAAR